MIEKETWDKLHAAAIANPSISSATAVGKCSVLVWTSWAFDDAAHTVNNCKSAFSNGLVLSVNCSLIV